MHYEVKNAADLTISTIDDGNIKIHLKKYQQNILMILKEIKK
ncbi:MAG: hypothetical protein V8S33_04770 [Intestinibacter bartlettii]